MSIVTCGISYIPVRKEPSHSSEQITQLIYGETASIVEKQKDWLFIACSFDNYEGWVERKSITSSFEALNTKTTTRSQIIYLNSGKKILIPHGADIHFFNDDNISSINGENYNVDNEIFSEREIIKLASDFLGSPYLWGGRTMFGIDCSGLSQIVMKCLGIKLPRDASQQVNFGTEVPFTDMAQPGDLAFFENDESVITHVGIITGTKEIIHASGEVRKDKLDQQGIFNEKNQEYTHKLRVIKRLPELEI
jgi:hypothetical protein